MSAETVDLVVQRVLTDSEFQQRCFDDPVAALAEYDLTDDERAAIMSGERERLKAIGVDSEMAEVVANCCCCCCCD